MQFTPGEWVEFAANNNAYKGNVILGVVMPHPNNNDKAVLVFRVNSRMSPRRATFVECHRLLRVEDPDARELPAQDGA